MNRVKLGGREGVPSFWVPAPIARCWVGAFPGLAQGLLSPGLLLCRRGRDFLPLLLCTVGHSGAQETLYWAWETPAPHLAVRAGT